MGLFETVPQLFSSSTAFTGSSTLTSEIVSADSLNIFIWAIVSGLSVGILFAIFRKVTWWIWK